MPPSPLTIVHLITSLGGGGTENFLYQILQNTPTSYRPSVAYLQKDGVIGDRIRALGIEVERTPTPWHVARYLGQKQPHILHTCLYWANQIGRCVGHFKKVPRIVSSQRAIQVWEKPWHPILDRWTLPLCHGVIANSTVALRLIEDRLKGRTTKPTMTRIHNGLDFQRFRPQNRDEARRKYGIPKGAMVGGTLARLHIEKGAERIPDFAESLLNKHPQLILLVAGIGPLLTTLQKRTKQWGDRLRFVGWQEDSAGFLSCLDFFWLLSREESFPQSLLEASGAAVPWAAPDIGDIPELLKAGAAGRLYPVNDMPAIVQECSRLIQHSTEWAAKADQARPTLEKEYSLERMARQYYTFMEQIL